MSRLGPRSQQRSGSWLAAGDLCILHPPVAQQEHHIPSCELRPGPYSADPAGAVQAQTDLQQPSPQAASQQQAAHELHCRGMVAGQAMSEGGCSRSHPAAQHTQQPGYHTASQGVSSSGSSTVMLPPPGAQLQYQRFSNASSAASGAGPNNTTARGGGWQADGEGLLQGTLPPEGQQVWSIPLEYHHPCLHEAPAMAAQQHLPLSRADPRTGAGSGVLCLSPAGMPHQHKGQEEHAAPALAGALDASAAASLGTMVAGPGSAGQTLQQARRSIVPEDQVQEPAPAPAQVLSVTDRGWRADTAGVPAGEPPAASPPGWGSGVEAAHATGGHLDTAGAEAAAGGGTWAACTQQQASGLHLTHQSTPAAMSPSQADGHSIAGAPDLLPPPPVGPSAANGMHGGGAEDRRNGAAHAPWDLARATSPAPFPPGTADVQAGQAPTSCAAASSPSWAQPRAPTPNPTPVATIQPAAPTAPASWAEAPPAAAPWPRPSAEAVPEPVREIQQLISELRGDRGSELTILHPIGQGGFGTVYKGLWRNLEVAVKTVLFQDKATNGQSAAACHISPAADDAGDLATSALAQQHSQARAVLEAAVTSSIAHPNVVATYHYDIIPVRATEGAGLRGLNITHAAQVDWKLYLVQEFCDAGALSTAFDQRYFHSAAGLPYLEMVLCILQDIARGMAHIHSKSVIHGDLTPTNILLKHDMNRSSRFLAKIADFGLCATITPGKTHISNIRNGTPFYAAPETTASGILSKASDAYSFGVLMWELFTGRVPWEATPTGFMPAKDFKKFPRGTPSGYVSLCLQCLDSNPRARPSFDTALQRLDTLLAKLMQKAAKLQQQHSQGQPQPQVNHSLQPVFGAQQHLQQQLQQQQQQQVVQHQYLAPATLPPSLTYLSSPGTVMGPGVPPGLQQNHHCPMPHGSPMAPATYCSAANVSSPNASGPYAPQPDYQAVVAPSAVQ
ncbi:kinase-like domain-containing protein [Haematococcus lacustris]